MKKLLTIILLVAFTTAANAQVKGDTSQAYLTCPDDNHPHLIDLGLSSGTKWACCNVDDNPSKQSPTNYGSYYAWGEVKGKSMYYQMAYKYATGVDEDGNGSFDDWHDDTETFGIWQNLGSDIAGIQYDVAHVKWGGLWVMPSLDQIEELLDNCKYEWITINGVNGGCFTGPNGGIIFLPATGYRWREDHDHAGILGYYWSSTQNPANSIYAFNLRFDSSCAVRSGSYYRNHGFTVRPVSR